VGHEYGQTSLRNDVARRSAEDELAQTGLGVGTLDQKVTVEFGGLPQNHFTERLASPVRRIDARADPVVLELSRKLIGGRFGRAMTWNR
jgi:hypothetical protein